jgi:hypothetical protein
MKFAFCGMLPAFEQAAFIVAKKFDTSGLEQAAMMSPSFLLIRFQNGHHVCKKL